MPTVLVLFFFVNYILILLVCFVGEYFYINIIEILSLLNNLKTLFSCCSIFLHPQIPFIVISFVNYLNHRFLSLFLCFSRMIFLVKIVFRDSLMELLRRISLQVYFTVRIVYLRLIIMFRSFEKQKFQFVVVIDQ